ncbi:MAG: DNA-binding protein WhiA [Faecousia sp.]
MRSFSASAKAEICRSFPQSGCCALAECFGILLFCNSFRNDSIKIITESTEFAAILPKLFKKAFGFGFDVLSGDGKGGKLVFQIQDAQKLSSIMNAFGFDAQETFSLHINLPIVENDCCKAAFLRGAFLSGGSVTDPVKGYHLELATTHHSVAKECYLLIQETLGFLPKLASRSGGQVIYLKQSEQIADFLTFLGASVASMGIIEARLEHELNNQVNRRCNCDDANITKVVEASQEHLNAIRTLREKNRFDQLPEKLKQAALVREENPEASLTELAGMVEPKISKPAMNHRLKRLVELALEEEP